MVDKTNLDDLTTVDALLSALSDEYHELAKEQDVLLAQLDTILKSKSELEMRMSFIKDAVHSLKTLMYGGQPSAWPASAGGGILADVGDEEDKDAKKGKEEPGSED